MSARTRRRFGGLGVTSAARSSTLVVCEFVISRGLSHDTWKQGWWQIGLLEESQSNLEETKEQSHTEIKNKKRS